MTRRSAPPGEHVGGEGMAQRVRMKVRHADEAAGLGDEGVHALARQPPPRALRNTAEVDFAYERTSSGRPRSR